MRIPILLALAAVAGGSPAARAQSHDHDAKRRHTAPRADTAFQGVQNRGARVMGVDQYTSSHRFQALADGGRIELQRNVDDTAGVRMIRDHLRTIAKQFEGGDFSSSATVHARVVPGTTVMRARRDAIAYEFRPLARGGEVRIRTRDPHAVRAVHEFLAFQRSDHRTEK